MSDAEELITLFTQLNEAVANARVMLKDVDERIRTGREVERRLRLAINLMLETIRNDIDKMVSASLERELNDYQEQLKKNTEVYAKVNAQRLVDLIRDRMMGDLRADIGIAERLEASPFYRKGNK